MFALADGYIPALESLIFNCGIQFGHVSADCSRTTICTVFK